MSANHAESEQAIRAAAATLVLLEGASVNLVALLDPDSGSREVRVLQRALCEGSREQRARALSRILTSMALALDDWRIA